MFDDRRKYQHINGEIREVKSVAPHSSARKHQANQAMARSKSRAYGSNTQRSANKREVRTSRKPSKPQGDDPLTDSKKPEFHPQSRLFQKEETLGENLEAYQPQLTTPDKSKKIVYGELSKVGVFQRINRASRDDSQRSNFNSLSPNLKKSKKAFNLQNLKCPVLSLNPHSLTGEIKFNQGGTVFTKHGRENSEISIQPRKTNSFVNKIERRENTNKTKFGGLMKNFRKIERKPLFQQNLFPDSNKIKNVLVGQSSGLNGEPKGIAKFINLNTDNNNKLQSAKKSENGIIKNIRQNYHSVNEEIKMDQKNRTVFRTVQQKNSRLALRTSQDSNISGGGHQGFLSSKAKKTNPHTHLNIQLTDWNKQRMAKTTRNPNSQLLKKYLLRPRNESTHHSKERNKGNSQLRQKSFHLTQPLRTNLLTVKNPNKNYGSFLSSKQVPDNLQINQAPLSDRAFYNSAKNQNSDSNTSKKYSQNQANSPTKNKLQFSKESPTYLQRSERKQLNPEETYKLGLRASKNHSKVPKPRPLSQRKTEKNTNNNFAYLNLPNTLPFDVNQHPKMMQTHNKTNSSLSSRRRNKIALPSNTSKFNPLGGILHNHYLKNKI